MISRNLLEQIIPYELSEEKIEEILSLETFPLRGNSKDLTGKRYDRLIAIDRGPTQVSPCGLKKTQWWCICDCPDHNIVLVTTNNLKSGNTKSCGCRNLEQMKKNGQKNGRLSAKDISNQLFGDLVALYPTDKRNNGSVVWVCRCSCGKIHEVSAKDLISHRICSCGHSHDSNGVKQIKKILDNNQIYYETEKTFEGCVSPIGGKLRFDFYVENNYLIEFDGEQHFKETSSYFKDTLEERQSRDRCKDQWCKEHNIPLIRIPYTQVWNLTLKDLQIGSDFTVTLC